MGWGCAVLIALVPVGIFMRGVMLQWLWLWFVVPFGVTALSLPWALGLATVAHAFIGSPGTAADQEKKPSGELIFKAGFLMIANPLLGLVLGWIYHTWM